MNYCTKSQKFLCLTIFYLTLANSVPAQVANDTTENKKWNFHFQNTVIYQYHPSFSAKYSGINSLNPGDETPGSITATLFLGTKLWKGATACFNSEISGGGGFSETRGIAGFPNGEAYRVSDSSPQIYVARFFIRQLLSLSDTYKQVQDEANQLPGRQPTSYFSVTAGKFSIMDYFDNNKYSHDPRSQFFNWALIGNGAWDYPANTRGYTYGFVTELVKPKWALRFASVMVPETANGATMDKNILRSNSEVLEFEHKYKIGVQSGTIRMIAFLTQSRMGNYKKAIEIGELFHTAPAIDRTNTLGRTKNGIGVNIEHNLSKQIGLFFRASWNDGHNETWAFTEIDRAISGGAQSNGNIWNRNEDRFGFSLIANGLSKDHRYYLKAGGYGFIIGDGNLNYQPELITELYYSYKLNDYPFYLSPDYQFIINPGYNKDRGPIHVFGIRAHVEI